MSIYVQVCCIIFGGVVEDYPHPGLGVAPFIKKIASVNNAEPNVWCPITKRMSSWVEPIKIGAIAAETKCIIS